MKLLQYIENNEDLKNKILELEKTVWFVDGGYPSALNTYVTSFVLIDNDKAIGHILIRKSDLFHCQRSYLAFGISEVIIHPEYQGKGIGLSLVKKAVTYILKQNADIIIFTCKKEQAVFYQKAGFSLAKGTCFVGGSKDKPFRSDEFKLATMIKIISPAAKLAYREFENTDLVFNLKEGQLW